MYIFDGQLTNAIYMVWAGAAFDFLDGMAARLVKAQSAIGKELDSLADMVTFGALPGFFLYHLILEHSNQLAYAGLLVIVFSAIRLAKFNVDTRQSEYFIGLPTPAHTLFVTSLPFLGEIEGFAFALQPTFLVIAAVAGSLLMVSELPLLSLKFKNFKWADNRFRWILVVAALAMLLVLGLQALSLVVILYIFISLLWNLIDKPVVN